MESFAMTAIEWWPEVESNHRHTDFQSVALPTELSGRGNEGGQNHKEEIFLDFRSSIKSKFLEILREQVMFEG